MRRRRIKEETEAQQKCCKTAVEGIIKTVLSLLDRGAHPHEHVISYSVTHLWQFYCSEYGFTASAEVCHTVQFHTLVVNGRGFCGLAIYAQCNTEAFYCDIYYCFYSRICSTV